ncbi:hypothetical protein EJB05_13941, partial [Eragrostis curvula]
MDESGGEIAGSAKPSYDGAGDGNDRLSALPDDILVLILLRLDTADAAGRTSVLSRRWRRVWTLLPELRFRFFPAPHLIAAALAAHEVPLRHLFVGTEHAGPEPMADCLRAAARRLSGQLIVENRGNADEVGEEDPAFEIPCFERATTVSLYLGFLRIAMPPAGVFSRLTELTLICITFHGPPELGDAVSSPRCPSLQKLCVQYTFGLVNLAIHSESLLKVELNSMVGLRQLIIHSLTLKELKLVDCFSWTQPVADISAPQLEFLHWRDLFDPSSVQLGEMAQLQWLITNVFLVYGQHGSATNHAFLRLLERFQAIDTLQISLIYPKHIGNFQYLMEDVTAFPRIEGLAIYLRNEDHAFGASVFNVLRMCTGLGRFALVLDPDTDLEARCTCPSGCICDQSLNWKTEELTLNDLYEVLIIDLKGTEHELDFVKRLFSWATKLKSVKIRYTSKTASKAKEVHEKVLSLAMPDMDVTSEARIGGSFP